MSSKKSLALIVNSFWVTKAGNSGGDQRAMQIFKRIGESFDLTVYTSAIGAKIYKNEIKARYIVSPASLESGNIFLTYIRRNRWLKKELQKREFDILYSASDFFPDVLPAYDYKRRSKSKKRSVKWIAPIFHIYPNFLTRPGNKVINLVGTIIQRWSFMHIRRLADRVININFEVREKLVSDFHFNLEKITINPCGIDFPYFKKIRSPRTEKLTACFLARLAPSKGIFDLPEIWQQVVKKVPQAKLKIIGGGSDQIKKKLKSEFIDRGLSKNFQLLGFLPDDKAYSQLKSSELFIFPSHEEGFGIAIAEAMACDLPVVAFDLPVYREVFPEGIARIKSWDKKIFADKIVEFLKNPAKRLKLAKLGAGVVKRYSWEKIAKAERELLNN